MVGNKDTLKSTHKGNLRFNNLVFTDVLFVPGLLQTLISEPQLEKKGCRIVSEKGVRTISKGGRYLFHAVLERNSYVFKPHSVSTNSRVMEAEEIVLVTKETKVTSAQLWHLRMGHLNFQDMVKLKSRAFGMRDRRRALFLPDLCHGKNEEYTVSESRSEGHSSEAEHMLRCVGTISTFPRWFQVFAKCNMQSHREAVEARGETQV